jgi:hypothetical protein
MKRIGGLGNFITAKTTFATIPAQRRRASEHHHGDTVRRQRRTRAVQRAGSVGHGAFDGVVVKLDAAFVDEARLPTRQSVADGLFRRHGLCACDWRCAEGRLKCAVNLVLLVISKVSVRATPENSIDGKFLELA